MSIITYPCYYVCWILWKINLIWPWVLIKICWLRQDTSVFLLHNRVVWFFSQIALLEWTDDLEAFILKGYGNSLNYRSAVPLLLDIIQSMEQAILAKEGQLSIPSRNFGCSLSLYFFLFCSISEIVVCRHCHHT